MASVSYTFCFQISTHWKQFMSKLMLRDLPKILGKMAINLMYIIGVVSQSESQICIRNKAVISTEKKR